MQAACLQGDLDVHWVTRWSTASGQRCRDTLFLFGSVPRCKSLWTS